MTLSEIASLLFMNYAPIIKPFFWVIRIDSYERFQKKIGKKSWISSKKYAGLEKSYKHQKPVKFFKAHVYNNRFFVDWKIYK